MTYKTLTNALKILGYFTPKSPAWGVRELAKASGIHSSIVHRTLATFAASGFMDQDPHTRRYLLSAKVHELNMTFRERLHISDIITPHMRDMARDTAETAFTTYLDGNEGVCIDIAESPNSLKYSTTHGTRFPLHAGANVKVILAFMPPEKAEQILTGPLPMLGKNTVCDPDILRQQLQEIRAQRWCYTEEEFIDETFCLACPLILPRGVIGSISIAGLIPRTSTMDRDTLIEMVSNTARTMQRELEKAL